MIVEFLEALLHLKVGVEAQQFFSKLTNHVLLLGQHLIERMNVTFDVTARFVDFRNESHLVLLYVYYLVHMLFMALDQVLFLAKDHANQLVVVLVHLFQVYSVIVLHFCIVWHRWQVLYPFQQHKYGQRLII